MPDASRRTPKVLVVSNENPDWPEKDKVVATEMWEMLVNGLRQEGYIVEGLKFFDDLTALEGYDPHEWLVWNWGEEWAGLSWSEAEVARRIGEKGFAYTGSPPEVIASLMNRPQVKERLQAAGLPTLPARVFTDPTGAADWSTFPAIVKGANQHASYGISGDSIVYDPGQLRARIAFMRDNFNDDSLVEQFLPTREFHVAVWGNVDPEALPPVEFDYSMFSDVRDQLYTYDWKFDKSSRGYQSIKMPCPAPADRPDWQARLQTVAREAYKTLGLRDYGRFDLRMLGDEPQILDVNPNPDLDHISVVLAGAKTKGMNYGQMISQIVQFAATRLPH